MNEYAIRLIYLFNLYYSGEATSEQTAELMTLVREGKHDAQLDDLLSEALRNQKSDGIFFTKQESDQIFYPILESSLVSEDDQADHTQQPLRFSGFWRLAAAAAFLIIGFGAFYNFKITRTEEKVAVVKPVVKDLPPGGNRAMLTLADGSTIVLDSAANGLLAMQGHTRINKTEDGQLVYDSEKEDIDQSLSQINVLSTPKGGQYQIFLPDGSKVWLNASSSISYPAAFAKNERRVQVTGEVFFEVKKDKSKPFKVIFGQTEVEALGTSFNVMAYKEDLATITTLVEGSVSVTNNRSNKILKPGQQASVSTAGNITTRSVDIQEAIAWKKGLFYFRDAGIELIMKKVARWYDVEIRYEGAIPLKHFTGKIPMDVNISELLQMLSYTGVACRIENEQVIISNK
jgi:ferric-dicitrate binding protein FerR (iron transport regulator)